MTIKPRKYQAIAIKLVRAALRKTKRALVDMATGLGKTFTGAFIVKEMKPRRTLFLVHNNFILDNAMSEFRLVLGKKMRMALYNGRRKNGSRDAEIVFATWQTMKRNLKSWGRDYFDLIIVDEAHHSEAETWKPVTKYFTGAKLALTATPDREDEADIRSVFGDEVVKITLEEAIARGWLPRIEYHVVTDESLNEDTLAEICEEIRERHRRFSIDEVNKRVFIRKRDAEIARIINGYKEKALVFCPSISHANRFAKHLEFGETFHSSKDKNARRCWDKNQRVLERLREGSVWRVCAVDAFNEGVNVPSIGLIAFCRVTGSIRIFRQQLGRGLRPGKDKLIALDFVANLQRIKAILQMVEKIADLHEEFTSEEEREREGYTRNRFEVSGAGFKFTFSDKIVDLIKVLATARLEFYPTFEEASATAINLGIKSLSEYKKMYKKDLLLPSNPQQIYPGFDWYTFLGKKKANHYLTWENAGVAARKLGLKSKAEYQKGCKADPRLPYNPAQSYADFPGWHTFLKKEKKQFYKTLRQASRAAVKLGITSQSEYNAQYSKDPLLPSNPATYYSDFEDWVSFLGRKKKSFYKMLAQAKRATKRLGIQSQSEYRANYKRDEQLPSNPNLFYRDFGSWVSFLDK